MKFFFILLFAGVSFAQTPTPSPTPTIRETVTISADSEQPIEQVSKTTSVIDGQEMRNRADITLVDSLRTVGSPGTELEFAL